MNTENFQEFIGPYLPPEIYGVDSMSSQGREEFFKWYNKQKGEFNFRKEMHEYCVSDVDILRKGCLKFRNLMLSITGKEVTSMK